MLDEIKNRLDFIVKENDITILYACESGSRACRFASPDSDYNRDYLLNIRNGSFDYEELIDMVDFKMKKIEALYAASDLPEAPDVQKAQELLVTIRERFYENS